MQYEVAHRIYAKEINEVIGIQHISLGLAHLSIALQQPRMPEYLLRKRKTERHQKDRPVNRMETDDIFSDQVQVCRPVFLKQLTAVAVTVIADTCDIVGQCIQPYIYDMLVIKVDRNAPFEGCSRYTQILQTRQQEVVHHLVFSGYRLDKLRMCIDMFNQTVCIFAHFKEICLLLRRLYLTSAIRAFAVYELRLRPEGLARRTVQSLVRALVNIPLLIQLFENLLYLQLMLRIRCTDKFVIGRIHQIPDTTDLACNLINMLLWCDPGCFGLQFDLLTMLIGACLKKHIISLLSFEPGNAVCQHDLIRISNVRLAGCIRNRGRNIIFWFTHRNSSFSCG